MLESEVCLSIVYLVSLHLNEPLDKLTRHRLMRIRDFRRQRRSRLARARPVAFQFAPRQGPPENGDHCGGSRGDR